MRRRVHKATAAFVAFVAANLGLVVIIVIVAGGGENREVVEVSGFLLSNLTDN